MSFVAKITETVLPYMRRDLVPVVVLCGVVGVGLFINASHQRTADVFGYEGVGVVRLAKNREHPYQTGLVAFIGERVVNKKTGETKKVLSVPGGKAEFLKDLFAALFGRPGDLWKAPQRTLAETTAIREFKEETGVDIKPKDLELVTITGHRDPVTGDKKTTTGQPVYLFQMATELDLSNDQWKKTVLPADTKDFKDVTIAPFPVPFNWVMQFRGFNIIVLKRDSFMLGPEMAKLNEFKQLEKLAEKAKKEGKALLTPNENARYFDLLAEVGGVHDEIFGAKPQ